MLSREEKYWAFLVAMNYFEDRFADEIRAGMTDEKLTGCLVKAFSFRLIWGGPGRFSGRCDPIGLKIYAGPSPPEVSQQPILAGREVLQLAREEFKILDPSAVQLSLF